MAGVVSRTTLSSFVTFAVLSSATAVFVFGCARSKSDEKPDGGAQVDASRGGAAATSNADASSAPAPGELADPLFQQWLVPVIPEEARRARLDTDPALAAYKVEIARSFDGGTPSNAAVQATPLSLQGRQAVLVGDAHPQLFVFDGRKPAPLWTRDRPVAGITPPIGQFALAAGPKGRVAIAVCDPPTSLVALRILDDDGSPFADLQALDFEGPAELSLLYWQKHGWVIAASSVGTTRAQLMTEDGKRTWGTGKNGRDVATRPQTASPVALVADTDDTLMMVQIARASSDMQGHAPRAYAFRYDAQGEPLWKAPLDLGAIKATAAAERAILARTRPGVVTAKLPGGAVMDIRSTGEIERR
ncbi:hypothetical protein AKJ09_01178 [Labilithrix luteola]|uniref:Uncharacterized protein n=1 Tax=Labilithrix luteola TaxID=1391654 RepID=A0A0K1PN24_9BACT|nr:hypothetical protein [Labilithrix luteola]AKU94514.1 hypothetical protein AKJ09_01178 [Labilithrix luteola]